jgi:hypothetical protein
MKMNKKIVVTVAAVVLVWSVYLVIDSNTNPIYKFTCFHKYNAQCEGVQK